MIDINFSVLICVYGKDNPNWFITAVESILNQSVTPNEVVLVVDGPVPNELEKLIKIYESNPIFRVIRLETNQGLGKARREGLIECTNELVAVMDSDDISVPNRFEQQIACFTKDDSIDIVGGDITEFIGDESNIIASRKVPCNDEAIKAYMKKRCALNHMSIMFKKSAVMDAGNYIEWYYNEDYYLWIRMQLNGAKFANTGTVLVNVRTGADMYARRGGIKYYRSEKGIQKLMLDNHMIKFTTYLINCSKRFIVQVLLPNKIRGYVFRKFARSKADSKHTVK